MIEFGRLKEADKYMKLSAAQIQYEGEESYNAIDFYYLKGDYEYQNKINNSSYLDDALAYYSKALQLAEKREYEVIKEKLYPKMADIYGLKKNIKLQNDYLQKGLLLKDSIEIKNNASISKVKEKLYSLNDKNNNTAETKKISTMLIFFFTAIIIFIVLGIIFRKNIFRTISENKKAARIDMIPDTNVIHNSELRSVPLNKLLNLLQQNDMSFYLTFLDAYPDFSEKLLKINPTMKSSDIEFCAYIKLNLETKQIARFKNMSVRAVEGRKYRIRKKLNISADENMYTFVQKL